MKQESLPPIKSVYRALEGAALDLYGFAVVCHGGASWLAEPDLLEVLFLGLENFWFMEETSGELTHKEFRDDFFRVLWEKAKNRSAPVRIGTEVPLGHEEMGFYQLSQPARAALFLRTKKRFSYAAIALTLGQSEAEVRAEVEKAREFLLGRRVKAVEWNEDDF